MELKAGISGVGELKAGRELDALVAKMVFQKHPVVTERGVSVGLGWDDCPRYSTDIAAAMPVAEKLGLSLVCSEDGWYAIKPVDIRHYTKGTQQSLLTLVAEPGQIFAPSETPSLAVCIEALRLAESSSFGEPEG